MHTNLISNVIREMRVHNTLQHCQNIIKLQLHSTCAENFAWFRHYVPSVLWHCWLGSRKGIRPVKNWVVGCWRGYLSGVMCRFACGPADATATRCLLLQENPDWFYLSGTGSLGSPRQRAIIWVCVWLCVCVRACVCVCVFRYYVFFW